jgi:predicted nucleic acid-binding protein
MLRVVVDTNCLLASINPRGAYFRLYELFLVSAFEWVISNEILTEYEEQVTQRYSVRTAQQVHEVLTTAANTCFQEAYYKWQLIEAAPPTIINSWMWPLPPTLIM